MNPITLFNIGNISLGTAWMISSAAVFIGNNRSDGGLFMFAGFLMLGVFRIVEYYYIDHMIQLQKKKW
jgi:hypothetical protein